MKSRYCFRLNFVLVFWVVISTCAFAEPQSDSTQQESGQKQSKDVCKQVQDHSDEILIIHSAEQFKEHSREFLGDLGFGAIGRGLFEFGEKDEFAEDRPIVFYDHFFGVNGIASFPILDESKVAGRFEDGFPREKPESVFDGEILSFLESRSRKSLGFVKDERLFISDQNKALVDLWKNDRSLAEVLPPESRKFVNENGIVFLRRVTDEDKRLLIWPIDDVSADGDDKDILKKFRDVAELAKFGLVSATYEEKTIDVRGQAVFEQGQAAGEIFDFSKADKDFQPTLGLPRNGMVGAICIDYRSLKSPELSRIIPLVVDSPNDFVFFDPRWVIWFQQVFVESWYELDTARVGVYEVKNQATGLKEFCVIGIVKPKDELKLMASLQKTFSLVTPEKNVDENLAKEVDTLIGQLASQKYSERQRASNKLLMIGWPAREKLEAATKSSDPEVAMRAKMVFRQLNARNENAKRSLTDPSVDLADGFSPRLSFTKERPTLAGITGNVIGFDLANETGEQKQVRKVIQTAFGSNWQRVEVYKSNGHYVFMIGSARSVLEEALIQIRGNKNPIAAANSKLGPAMQGSPFSVHFSLARLNNIIETDEEFYFDVESNEISSLGTRFSPNIWEAVFLFPITELKVLMNSRTVGFGWGMRR